MNYILYADNAFLHFFHSQTKGLCLKIKKNGRWSQTAYLCPDAKDGFSVYLDKNEKAHILCSNINNDIIYITNKNSEWQAFVLSVGKPDISPIEFKIASSRDILSFFYTAHFKDSVILVHCVLGKNAKPESLDTLLKSNPEFSVSSGKVYYTNKDNILGCRDFSDGKPDEFVEIAENAVYPYAVNINSKEYLLYKKDGFIFLNNNKIFSDPLCISPCISSKDNKLCIQWKSNNFVRYLTSFNNGVTWSCPMRFIGSSEKILKFCIQTGEDAHICYGQDIKPEPVIYGKTNLFFYEAPSVLPNTLTEDFSPAEYKKLRILIDMQSREIKTLKSRIKKLENSD